MDSNSLRLRTPRPERRVFATVLGLALLGANMAHAQFIDLDIQTGAAPCDNTVDHGVAFDTNAAPTEQISALTDNIGDNVFWTLTQLPASSTVACTDASTGSQTILECDNGVDITLPGLSGITSVSSSLPVEVSIDAVASPDTVGEIAFFLQTTFDGGAFQSCEQLYSVTRNEAKQVFDLIYVLDRSGSMNQTAGTGTRWDALQWGTDLFNIAVQQAAQDPTPEGSQFGVTFFAGGVEPGTTGLSDILTGGLPSADSAGMSGLILAQSPSGSTAMGLGLQDALGKLTAANRNHVVLLFTDGEQNVSPEVAADGCSFDPASSDICASGVKICTVGINNPSSPYMTTLQSLADENNCGMIITDNGTGFQDIDGIPIDIGSAVESIITLAMDNSSPQQVARYSGAMAGNPVLAPFDVNQNVANVLLNFAFSERFETPQLLQLISGISVTRDGTPVSGEFTPIINGNFSGVLGLVAHSQPGRDLSGTYQVSLTLPDGFKSNLEYRMSAYVEELRIKTNHSVSPVIAGQSVDVSVQLDYLNTGIEGATVVVRAMTPGADMGELLSQGEPVNFDQGEDPSNPGVAKYEHLAANDPNFLAQLALQPNAIAMTDEGGGRYTGSFAVPDNVGVMHFVFDVSATGNFFGSLQRHWMESAYVGFESVDLDASDASWVQVEGGIQLSFTPVRPPSDKLVGPGNESAFTFEGANVVDVEDLQNGTYTYTLDTNDPATVIKINLLGKPLFEGPISEWGPSRGGGGIVDQILSQPWWVILILLILLLAFWFWRRATSP